ncbi:MAG: hypothetical protein M3Y56_13675 [Armatimonadota bacterium]|nr:hypothetical protein [Armatimonadota bacterium]
MLPHLGQLRPAAGGKHLRCGAPVDAYFVRRPAGTDPWAANQVAQAAADAEEACGE